MTRWQLLGRCFVWTMGVALWASCNGQFHFDDTSNADAGSGLHAPSDCVDDGDCRLSALHCDSQAHECVECINDGQCAAATGTGRCNTKIGRCVRCLSTSDCDATERCDVVSNACIEQCGGSSASCKTAGSRCDDGICRICDHKADCTSAAAPICNRNNGRCVECVSASDCASATPLCFASRGACVECITASDCSDATRPLCDPTSNQCVALPP